MVSLIKNMLVFPSGEIYIMLLLIITVSCVCAIYKKRRRLFIFLNRFIFRFANFHSKDIYIIFSLLFAMTALLVYFFIYFGIINSAIAPQYFLSTKRIFLTKISGTDFSLLAVFSLFCSLTLLFCSNKIVKLFVAIITIILLPINLNRFLLSFNFITGFWQLLICNLIALAVTMLFIHYFTIKNNDKMGITTYIYGDLVDKIPLLNWILFFRNCLLLFIDEITQVRNIKVEKYFLFKIVFVIFLFEEIFGPSLILISAILYTLSVNSIKDNYKNNSYFKHNFLSNQDTIFLKINKTNLSNKPKEIIIKRMYSWSNAVKVAVENPYVGRTILFSSVAFFGGDLLSVEIYNHRALYIYEQQCKLLNDANRLIDDKNHDILKNWNEANREGKKIAQQPQLHARYSVPEQPKPRQTRLMDLYNKVKD